MDEGQTLIGLNGATRLADARSVRTDDVIEELEGLAARARPIPLTDQVRLDPKQLQELLSQLREALTAERER